MGLLGVIDGACCSGAGLVARVAKPSLLLRFLPVIPVSRWYMCCLLVRPSSRAGSLFAVLGWRCFRQPVVVLCELLGKLAPVSAGMA